MLFYLIVFFIFGNAVGSFINVVIDRSVKFESLLGRSYCDFCRAKLSAFDLVPIVSFAALGGRCRYCRRKISWQYPAVEIACGILFTFVFYHLASLGILHYAVLAYYLFILSIFLIVAIVDLKYSLIPTSFVYLASFVALFYDYFYLTSDEFVNNVVVAFALALFFLLVVLITRGRGMGSGDIPLVFLIGLILGWPAALGAIFLAFVLGATVAIILLILGRKKFGQTIPFAPFLIFGAIIALFWSVPLISWYLGLF